MTDRLRLVQRVEKLLALGDSPNAHEAASALEKAQALMREHGVTQDHVDRLKVGERLVRSSNFDPRTGLPRDWETALASETAASFGCQTLWVPESRCYLLVGQRDHAQLAEFTLAFLVRSLSRFRERELERLESGPRGPSPDRWNRVDGLCWGWVEGVAQRARAFSAETGPGLAEVVARRVAEITDGSVASTGETYTVPEDDFRRGRDAGASVSIHRPAEGRAGGRSIPTSFQAT